MEDNVFSKRDCARRSTLGPYKATKLWNDLIRTFRNGMPVGRHWRHMKSYEDCFSASEAVSWLHAHLQGNQNFGPNVTRIQTILLLAKFHKIRIFEDVRSTKHNRGDFSDGGRLFRFINDGSPVKAKSTSTRIPLSTRTSLMNSASSPEITTSSKSSSKFPFKEKKFKSSSEKISRSKSFKRTKESIKLSFKKHSTGTPKSTLEVHEDRENEEIQKEVARLTAMEVENTWKNMILARLKIVLRLPTLDDILNSDGLNVRYLIHNMTQLNNHGVVTNIEKKDQLPKWVLSAMRCLAYWPEKLEDWPYYEAFEKDVFTALKDFFQSLDEPLTTFDMYDVFTNVMAALEDIDQIGMPPPLLLPQNGYGSSGGGFNSPLGPSPISLTSFTSLENLMADLTMNAPNTPLDHPSDVMIVNDPETMPDYNNMPDVVRTHSGINNSKNVSRYSSASSLSGAKLETSFGIYGEEPETRLIVKQISPTYLLKAHNTLVSPDSVFCNHSHNNSGNNSKLGFGRDPFKDGLSRDGSNSRASIRSAGCINSSNNSYKYTAPPPFVPHYNRFLDRNQRTTSVSTLQSSIDGSSQASSSPEYSIGHTMSTSSGGSASSAGRKSRYGSEDPPPRTCPEQGTYNHVSKSCVNLLNNVVSRSATPELNNSKQDIVPPLPFSQPPPLRYNDLGPGYNHGQARPHSQTNELITSILHRSTTSNTSASSYDTACSHLSNNRDSVNLSNSTSNNLSSVGSIGVLSSGVSCPRDSISSSVFSSAEINRPSPSMDGFQQRPSPLIDNFSQLRRHGSQRESSMSSTENPQRPLPGLWPSQQQRIPAPISNLQESYRIAVEGDKAMGTPIGKSLFGRPTSIRKSESSPNLRNFSFPQPKNRTLDALQICTLMLPPANRRQLHLLLRLMNKMANNSELQLSTEHPEKSSRTLVLESFSRCIMRSPEEVDFNEMLSIQVVSFMMDNYVELMKVPKDLKERIEDKIMHLRKNKPSMQSQVSAAKCNATATTKTEEEVVASGINYCQQMSMQAYENTKLSSSQVALVELLEDIIRNKQMSTKDKKKRLKQFQKHYPDIYTGRFPTSQSESDLFPNKPRIKPPLLARPLHKLRNLRL